jgi:hypothetical protein
MAKLFWVWKKKLWKNYLKKKDVPVFEGYLAKQANHCKAFQEEISPHAGARGLRDCHPKVG